MPVTMPTCQAKGRKEQKKENYARSQGEWGLFVPHGSALSALPPKSVHPGW